MIPALITLWVVKVGDSFCVRVNGKEVQRLYPNPTEAKEVARRGAIKQLQEALAKLEKGDVEWQEFV